MSARNFIGLACLMALAALSAPASAGQPSPVSLTSTVMLDKTETVAGKTTHKLVDPSITHDKVVPGNRLVFQTSYRNTGSKPIDNFVVTNQLPAAVVFSDDGPGAYEVSVDSGKTWGKLAALTVDDGKSGRRAAQASDVTALRWIVPTIAPGGSGILEYHAVVR